MGRPGRDRVTSLLIVLSLACSRAPADPRPAIRESIVDARLVQLDPDQALLEGRLFEACAGFKQRVKASVESDRWPQLLLAAARDPNCLPAAQGDQLSWFGADKPEWTDAIAEWNAAHGGLVPTEGLSASTRLRLALRGTDSGAVRRAATEAFEANRADTFACAIFVRDAIDRGELAEAANQALCGMTSEMGRLRAEALDAGGDYERAIGAYDSSGFTLHAAAILYQSLGQPGDALMRMDDPVPPVFVHRGWMAVMQGETPDVSALDASPESTMLRAIAGDARALAELPGLPGIEPKLLAARLGGDPALVEVVVALAPASRAVLCLDWTINHARPGGAPRLANADPDHLALAGDPGRREAPLAAILPGALRAQCDGTVPAGTDAVGNAWRAALKLNPISRGEALRELQAAHPELRVLARVRARHAWGLPSLPGDPDLDATLATQ